MTTVYLAPGAFGAGGQFLTTGGLPLNQGSIYTYSAGGTTPLATYTSSAGSVQNANPIVLGTDGRPPNETWLISGSSYRFDLKDSLGTLIKTYDNLTGIGDLSTSATAFGISLVNDANATAGRATLGVADATGVGSILTSTGVGAFSEKLVGANSTALIADSSQSNGLSWVPQYPKSLIGNPFFQIDQRHIYNTTAISNDTYAQDCWYILTQTAAVNVATSFLQENGQAYNCLITQNQAAAQRFGIAQIIESLQCQWLRGAQVTFRPRVRLSTSQAVRIAILEWTGTADAVTSNVVNNWTSSTYTAGNFFLASNLTVDAVGAKTPVINTWTDMDALTVTLGTTFNNLIVFAWIEGTAAQNFTFEIGKVRFVPGPYAGTIDVPDYLEALRFCKRYYWASFQDGVLPAQNAGLQTGEIIGIAGKAGATTQVLSARFDTEMRSAPAMTYYNPAATNAQIRDTTAAADCSATATLAVSLNSFAATATGNAGTAVGNALRLHATADASL